MKYWQTIFHFTFQNSDVEGSDVCNDDSDWVKACLDLVPVLWASKSITARFVNRKVAFLIWESSTAGDYVLAEQEVDAQEKMSGVKENQQEEDGQRLCTDWYTWLAHVKTVWWESSFLKDSCNAGCLNCCLNNVFITRLPGNSILNLCNLYVKMRQNILIHFFFWIIFMKLWLHDFFFSIFFTFN